MSGGGATGAGARVVAVGGGHGLANTLRAVQPWAARLTAVVSVADDGGSTGRLRAAWHVPAIGDARRCLSTLAGDSGVWSRALERRFDAGELEGHVAGNLLLLALTAEAGGLQAACDEVARLLGIDRAGARVVPVTDEPVVLMGRTASGLVAEGQVAVSATPGVEEVWVAPEGSRASTAALDAIRDADLVVLGPGSLFSSVLAAVVVGGVREALAETPAPVVFVSNLRWEAVEARGYGPAAQLAALDRHGVRVDRMIAQQGTPTCTGSVPVVVADVAGPGGLAHDPAALGAVLRTVVG